MAANDPSKRVLLLGATGTAGRATAGALVRAGHRVVCFVRSGSQAELEGVEIRFGDVTDPASLRTSGFGDTQFNAVVSCLASRTGSPKDAWAIDYQANANALLVAKEAGVSQFVLLSAICVQKPLLEFQHAKLALEKDLTASGLRYSIVRPTAFFKSLAGQIARVQQGKSFLVFGDGKLTSCTPISDHDLGDYIAGCLTDPSRQNKILPIGGPGPALTPLDQGHILFGLLGKTPKFRHVPVALLDGIHALARTLGRISPKWSERAEFVRIGRYYATESMLVFDPVTGRYDAGRTPAYGTETLADYYRAVLEGRETVERGDHAVF